MDYRNADERFLAEARKRSPQYPDVNEALARIERQRETIAARVLLVLAIVFAVSAPFATHVAFTAAAATACAVGFAITCLVSGNRSWRRSGSPR